MSECPSDYGTARFPRLTGICPEREIAHLLTAAREKSEPQAGRSVQEFPQYSATSDMN